MAFLEYGTLTWPDVERLDRDRTIVLLPMGSVEQHGYHGPLMTDALVSMKLARPVAELMPEMSWLAMPPIVYGYARHSAIFPGTVSVEAATLSLLVRDVLRGMFRQGFRKAVILNSHFENAEFAIDGAVTALEGVEGGRVLMMMWWEFIPESVVLETFGSDWRGWMHEHAGLMETSLMLSIAPDVVHLDRVRDDRSTPSPYRFRVLPWQRSHFAESGSTLRAGVSRERGDRLLGCFLESAKAFLREEFGGERGPSAAS